VLPRQDLECQVAEAIGRHPDSAAIVYCIARKDCEALAKALLARGVDARACHAGLPAGERTQISADFRAERLSVVVATVAFGYGHRPVRRALGLARGNRPTARVLLTVIRHCLGSDAEFGCSAQVDDPVKLASASQSATPSTRRRRSCRGGLSSSLHRWMLRCGQFSSDDRLRSCRPDDTVGSAGSP
jgi:hypothetical protein